MKIIILGYSGLIGRTILESLSKKSLQLVCVEEIIGSNLLEVLKLNI